MHKRAVRKKLKAKMECFFVGRVMANIDLLGYSIGLFCIKRKKRRKVLKIAKKRYKKTFARYVQLDKEKRKFILLQRAEMRQPKLSDYYAGGKDG